MTKTAVELALASRLINPGVVVLVSVGDGQHDNLYTVAWNMPVRKDPPMLAILSGKRHFSYGFIARTGEFGINVPHADLADAVLGCGKVSGRDEPDKFARFGLERQPARKIKAPLVAEAVAHLECRVCQVIDLGAQSLLVAQVLHAEADSQHFRDGTWRFERGLKLLHRLGGESFSVSERALTGRAP